MTLPRLQTVASGKRFVLALFRGASFTLAAVLILAFPTDVRYAVDPLPVLIASGVYTLLKILQPLRWHRGEMASLWLLGIDLIACFTFLSLTGGINSPYLLYALVPALTSSLLLAPVATVMTSTLTGGFIIVIAVFSPLFEPVEMIEHISQAGIYLVLLAVLSTVPYLFNSIAKKRLWSASILQERSRLGRELHDGLAQTIYGLRWQVQALKHDPDLPADMAVKMHQLEELLVKAETDTRDSIKSLRLQSGPFLKELREFIAEVEKEAGITITLHADDSEPEVDEMIRSETFIICREAILNAARHSGARNIEIEVTTTANKLCVVISDNGKGMEEVVYDESHGLSFMKARASSLGGKLEIISAPKHGTQVTIEVDRSWSELTPTE